MMGHTNLTVETAVSHHERLEVCKSAPLRRNATGELVGVVVYVIAKVEYLK